MPDPVTAKTAADPQPASETPPREAAAGSIFHALLRGGADAVSAYTLEEQLRTMTQSVVVTELRLVMAEIGRRFDQQDARLEALAEAGVQRDRRLEALAEAGVQRDRRLEALAEAGVQRDRRLDVLTAQLRLVLAGLGVLVTVLIAVFGFLFTTLFTS